MKKLNHTPGPWIKLNVTDVFTNLGAVRSDGLKADNNDGWQIADCDMGVTFCEDGTFPLTYEEKEANACLISAAPEMLEALVGVLDAAEERGYDYINKGHLKTVIQKATGYTWEELNEA